MERSTKSCLLFSAVPAFITFDLVALSTPILCTKVNAWPYSSCLCHIGVLFCVYSILLFRNAKAGKHQRKGYPGHTVQTGTDKLSTLSRCIKMPQPIDMICDHFAFLQGLASKGNIAEIIEYLRGVQSDIDAITPIRFCENETVNLILSSFSAKAEKAKIQLITEVKLTGSLPFTDTELCSLLSNALENAMQASEKISNSSERIIRVRLYTKNNKLCMDTRNSYRVEPEFLEGLPVSKEPGHGFGTKSMAHIIEKHGGVYQFTVKDGWFIFQATV